MAYACFSIFATSALAQDPVKAEAISKVANGSTNAFYVTNKHVKLAVGRNFADCSPAKGSFKGPAQQKLLVYVSVGYEDGASFEDSNNVRTNVPDEAESLNVTNPEAQQQ